MGPRVETAMPGGGGSVSEATLPEGTAWSGALGVTDTMKGPAWAAAAMKRSGTAVVTDLMYEFLRLVHGIVGQRILAVNR